MRILFATTNAFIPEHYSGQNRTLLELSRRLAALGHEPVVLAGKAAPHGRSRVTADHGLGFRLLRAVNPVRAVPAVCATLRPDIAVIADGHYEGLLEACRPLELPLAAWLFHAEPFWFRHGPPDEAVLFLATSRYLARRVRGLFGVEAEVVPPFVQRDAYRQAREGNRVLFVNPVREKGVELAFALARRRRGLAFTFVESWGLSERWRASCFERSMACGNVEWIPRCEELATVLARTRVLLVPRFSEEGFCRLVTEAQLGGVPVLASDRGALADNVGPGGTLVGADADLPEWLDRLDRLVSDHDLHARLAERARAHAEREELAEERVVERLLALLASHAERRRQRRFGRRR